MNHQKIVNKAIKQTEIIFKENFKKREIEVTLAISRELFCINNANDTTKGTDKTANYILITLKPNDLKLIKNYKNRR